MWNILIIIYVLFLFIFGTILLIFLIRDIATGRIERFKKLEKDVSEFEEEVKKRRQKILGENLGNDNNNS